MNENINPFVRRAEHEERRRHTIKVNFINYGCTVSFAFSSFLFFSYLFTQQSTLLSSAVAYPFSIANSLILASYTRVESGDFYFSLSICLPLLPSLRFCIFFLSGGDGKKLLLLSGMGFTREIWAGFGGFV
jgi:hypothetical protein